MSGSPAPLECRPCDINALHGAITEDTDLTYLLQQDVASVHIDLGDVTRINSCGVREWLDFVRQLETSGKRLVLKRCSPVVVGQLNLIYNFIGAAGVVESVLFPYECSACGLESHTAAELSQIADAKSVPVERTCPECSGVAEFADLPDFYLSFHLDR